MRFYNDLTLQDEPVQLRYGRYVESFESENGQLFVDLFQRGENLVAFVKFAPGFDATNVTDRWISLLRPEAERLGFASEKLHIVYTGTALPLSIA